MSPLRLGVHCPALGTGLVSVSVYTHGRYKANRDWNQRTLGSHPALIFSVSMFFSIFLNVLPTLSSPFGELLCFNIKNSFFFFDSSSCIKISVYEEGEAGNSL